MLSGSPKNDEMRMLVERSGVVAAERVPPYQVTGRPSWKGTVGVLTTRNEEALQLVGMFQHAGIKANLLQSMESYELANLQEVRAFSDALKLLPEFVTIPDDNWEQAKEVLDRDFGSSRHLPMVHRLLKTFEEQSGKRRFVSDWHTFLRESSEEDFLRIEQAAVYVSTMHKAKGREFDHVVLTLGNFQMTDEASKRILYVAMTRARQSLTLHACGTLADSLLFREQPYVQNLAGYASERDDQDYAAPEQLLVQMSFKDVHLGYFEFIQRRIAGLRSGDSLLVDAEGCLDRQGNRVLKFSKKGLAELDVWRTKGYVPGRAMVNHLLYWWKEDMAAGMDTADATAINASSRDGVVARTGKEILVLFPEIVLVRGQEKEGDTA